MDSFKDSVSFWATVLGTMVGLFGVLQSRAWLAAIGAVIAAGSIGSLIYAKHQRDLVKSASLRVAGRSIDSLNMASLRRRLNRNLIIQEAKNMAIIDGEDLDVTWTCAGYCRAERETHIEFSVDADANIPFATLDCVAYDLRRDPHGRHPIHPILVGPDGIAKKVAVPLLTPLSVQEPFQVALKYRLPACIKAGVDYYTATLSFAQDTVRRYVVRLRFLRGRPEWVRVYERRLGEDAKILKDLRPRSATDTVCEYVDIDEDVPATSARIYMFSRDL